MARLISLDYLLDQAVEKAVKLLRNVQSILQKPYWGCFSGGKDSCVIKQLAKEAEVDVVWYYSVTTMDPPELVQFIKKQHPEVIRNRPLKPLVHRMVDKGVAPTRKIRWCCSEYKESKSPKGALLLMGVRWAESPKRKNSWQELVYHHSKDCNTVCPIVSWTDEMVWSYIRQRSIPYCSLYDEGFSRLGCIGCPLASVKHRQFELDRWPRYEQLWQRGFQRMFDRHRGRMVRGGCEWYGSKLFANWQEMYEAWLSDEPLGKNKCQGLVGLFGE